MRKILNGFFFAFFLLLTACQSVHYDHSSAPITEGWRTTHAKASHVVQQGETLYAVAWRYGYDFRILAESNHIKAPYHVRSGQVISLSAAMGQKGSSQQLRSTSDRPKNLRNTALSESDAAEEICPPINVRRGAWNWPVHGKLIRVFGSHNKGIDIRGRLGQPVLATASGVVVYSGDGLRGYGNLIIIKHSDEYLSAYAHNRRLFVHEGQKIQAMQKIAEMGSSDSRLVKLHFEIRKAGRPIDPLLLLQR